MSTTIFAEANVAGTIATKGLAAGVWAMGKSLFAAALPMIGWIALAYGIYYVGQKLRIWSGLASIFGALGEVWASFSSSSGTFELKGSTEAKLKAEGLLGVVLSLSTWVIRLKVILGAMFDGFKAPFIFFAQCINWILDRIPGMGGALMKNTTDLQTWAAWGKWAGYTLALWFTIWGLKSIWAFGVQAIGWADTASIAMVNILKLRIGIMSLSTAMYASLGLIFLAYYLWDKFGIVGKALSVIIGTLVVAYWAWTVAQWALDAAMSPILIPLLIICGVILILVGLIALIGYAIYKLIRVVVDNWDAIVNFFKRIVGFVAAYYTAIWNAAVKAFHIGVQFVLNLWEGIKSVWHTIVNWIADKIAAIGNLIAAPFRAVAQWLGLSDGESTVNVNKTATAPKQMKSFADMQGVRSNIYNVTAGAQSQAGLQHLQPIVIQSKLHLDGKVVAESVNKHNANHEGRGGGYGE